MIGTYEALNHDRGIQYVLGLKGVLDYTDVNGQFIHQRSQKEVDLVREGTTPTYTPEDEQVVCSALNIEKQNFNK